MQVCSTPWPGLAAQIRGLESDGRFEVYPKKGAGKSPTRLGGTETQTPTRRRKTRVQIVNKVGRVFPSYHRRYKDNRVFRELI